MTTRINLREPAPLRWNAKPITYEIDGRGCWICTSHAPDTNGYPVVGRHKRHFRAHRYVYELLVHPVLSCVCVLHKCDVPSCINPDHMFLGTQAANVWDMVAKERHGSAKLCGSEVLELREKRKLGASLKELSAEFRVSESSVSLIVSGKRWRHL